MRFRLVSPTLEDLDEIEAQCLVLTTFSDDRPLRGLTGLVDWRLNGQLSRLMLRDFVDGHYQEATLSPIEGRLNFGRIVLIGMGKRSEFDAQRFEELCRFCFRTVTRMEIVDFAMTLPESFNVEQASQLQLVLLESREIQKEMLEPLRALEREMAELAVRAAKQS
jgi:hypothetical protein